MILFAQHTHNCHPGHCSQADALNRWEGEPVVIPQGITQGMCSLVGWPRNNWKWPWRVWLSVALAGPDQAKDKGWSIIISHSLVSTSSARCLESSKSSTWGTRNSSVMPTTGEHAFSLSPETREVDAHTPILSNEKIPKLGSHVSSAVSAKWINADGGCSWPVPSWSKLAPFSSHHPGSPVLQTCGEFKASVAHTTQPVPQAQLLCSPSHHGAAHTLEMTDVAYCPAGM